MEPAENDPNCGGFCRCMGYAGCFILVLLGGLAGYALYREVARAIRLGGKNLTLF